MPEQARTNSGFKNERPKNDPKTGPTKSQNWRVEKPNYLLIMLQCTLGLSKYCYLSHFEPELP